MYIYACKTLFFYKYLLNINEYIHWYFEMFTSAAPLTSFGGAHVKYRHCRFGLCILKGFDGTIRMISERKRRARLGRMILCARARAPFRFQREWERERERRIIRNKSENNIKYIFYLSNIVKDFVRIRCYVHIRKYITHVSRRIIPRFFFSFSGLYHQCTHNEQ